MINNKYKQIWKKIKEYNNIVIARHIGPDPDAIASSIALRDIIKLNFPKKKVIAIGAGVSKFKFLGLLDKYEELDNALLIILDVPSFSRVDGAKKENFVYTIKIDHHPCDEETCDIDFIDETSSSVCQIIAEMCYKLKIKMNDTIGANLFSGIVADSDRFLLSYTTNKTFGVVSKLMNDYNFDIMNLYNNLYEKNINERKFEAYIISNLTVTENGFGYIKIDANTIKKYEVDSSTPSNIVNNLNFIEGLKIWAFATYDEKNQIYKINIRSRGITINEIASRYNGGGHKFASGARIVNESDVDELFSLLDKEASKYQD